MNKFTYDDAQKYTSEVAKFISSSDLSLAVSVRCVSPSPYVYAVAIRGPAAEIVLFSKPLSLVQIISILL